MARPNEYEIDWKKVGELMSHPESLNAKQVANRLGIKYGAFWHRLNLKKMRVTIE